MFSYQDYIVIAIYFVFILSLGLFYRKANADSGDYFRGGGSMTWWMTGATVFMANFSAWTFIGCGGRIYKTGTLVVVTMFLMQAIFARKSDFDGFFICRPHFILLLTTHMIPPMKNYVIQACRKDTVV